MFNAPLGGNWEDSNNKRWQRVPVTVSIDNLFAMSCNTLYSEKEWFTISNRFNRNVVCSCRLTVRVYITICAPLCTTTFCICIQFCQRMKKRNLAGWRSKKWAKVRNEKVRKFSYDSGRYRPKIQQKMNTRRYEYTIKFSSVVRCDNRRF